MPDGKSQSFARLPLSTVALQLEQDNNTNRAHVIDSVSMGGAKYRNAIAYRRNPGSDECAIFTLHNLSSKYKTMIGYAGRIDGTGMINAVLNIYGDDTLLSTYSLRARDFPIMTSTIIDGVSQLKIEFTTTDSGVSYAFAGYLE